MPNNYEICSKIMKRYLEKNDLWTKKDNYWVTIPKEISNQRDHISLAYFDNSMLFVHNDYKT